MRKCSKRQLNLFDTLQEAKAAPTQGKATPTTEKAQIQPLWGHESVIESSASAYACAMALYMVTVESWDADKDLALFLACLDENFQSMLNSDIEKDEYVRRSQETIKAFTK